jgi:MtN3 and saliva related transmembrane protein
VLLDKELLTEAVGWTAAAILLLTVGRQVYTQWRAGTTSGVSKWLFVGQIAASVGFVIYSALLGNTVFVLTNCFMLLTACFGQVIFLRNRRREQRRTGGGLAAGKT